MAISPSQKPQPRPKPWVGKPLLSGYARAVQDVFDRVPMESSGWHLTGLKCGVSTCTATYKGDMHVATFWFRPQGTQPDIATKTVSRNYPLDLRLSGTQHIGKAHLSVWLMGWMQVHGIHGGVTSAVAAYQAIPYRPQRSADYGKPAQKFLPPTWKALSWTIRSILPPWQMRGISVDGVVPESADYNAEDGRWTITGGAYEPIK